MRKSVKVSKLSIALVTCALALSGVSSPAQADVPTLNNGNYVCTSGEMDLDGENRTYFIFNGVVSNGTGCSGAVVIPEGVTGIGAEAFSSESSVISISSITIPASVTSIGEYAFYLTSTLRELHFLGNAPTIMDTCAVSCLDTTEAKVYINAGATGFGTELTWLGLSIRRDFSNYTGSIRCETGVPLAVDDTSPAYTVTNGVVTSGSACVGTAVIPDGVINIGTDAFRGATALTSITIPASVTSIGNSAFDDTGALTTISVNPNNEIYSSLNGVLLNKSATTLIKYPAGKSETTYSIPEGVTSVSGGAFYGASSLTSITIPASVTTIESWAFEDASDLADVYFLGDAPAIVEEDAFSGMALGAEAHIGFAATGFGNDPAWNFLFIDRAAPAIYAVTYESTGGTAVSAGTFTEGGAIQTAPVSTRAGYTLVGWAARENGGVVTFPYAPGVTNDITLHAIWTQATTPVTPPTTTPKKTAISSYAAKFSVGSSVISQTGKTAIKKIVSKSGKDAKYTVTGVATKVAGVSDSRVKGLAKVRAEKVKAYLIKLGVKKSNITIKITIVTSGITPKTKILAKYLVS